MPKFAGENWHVPSFSTSMATLRPGTYEITSLRYDERDDLFLEDMPSLPSAKAPQFRLTNDERTSITVALG